MTSNLILNHGWWEHLFDGGDRNVRNALRFFSNSKDCFLSPPRFDKAWSTSENVNELIKRSGASVPVDLLSLDMDGMD
jgi:hypothetical protein